MTIEDILEEIIAEEIEDESDVARAASTKSGDEEAPPPPSLAATAKTTQFVVSTVLPALKALTKQEQAASRGRRAHTTTGAESPEQRLRRGTMTVSERRLRAANAKLTARGRSVLPGSRTSDDPSEAATPSAAGLDAGLGASLLDQ